MAAPSMTRRSRKYFKKIQRAKTRYDLQTIASTIQSELDRRNLSYDEALNLGNFIQNRADQLPGNSIVYAVSDRDAYRRTLELYLRDALLTRTEQLLLWEERRRLGISDEEHDRLLVLEVAHLKLLDSLRLLFCLSDIQVCDFDTIYDLVVLRWLLII
ncbi:MAG: hypothetical protein VXW14_04160, partial [Candidatus Thermoplasmatota archaeon]|nr:hypothetical protein [Candidatus Thermoplasmatota archaeon]